METSVAMNARARPRKARAGEIRIGVSGWRYAGWRGRFYPRGLKQKDELGFVARAFATVELNGSFYSLQTAASYRRWAAETPDDFCFAIKGSRYITHMKRLKGVEQALANFFASGVLGLGTKLGPFLWQLPPSLSDDPPRFADFFSRLPRTSDEAAALARGHDSRVKDPFTDAPPLRKLRHAVEVRHPSLLNPHFIALLRRFNIALVFADTAGKFPYAEDLTADFAYLRLHGPTTLYASGYNASATAWWAARVRAWAAGAEPPDARRVAPAQKPKAARDVYVYFDNDAKVDAPYDAERLRAAVGL